MALLAIIFYPPLGYSDGYFPIATKNYSTTLVKLEGINTDHALAVGKVKYDDAEEYCLRDPGGETKKMGGKLTDKQCINNVLKMEKDKMVSATVDCIRKKITPNWGVVYVLRNSEMVSGPNDWRYTWADDNTGEVLSNGYASGETLIETI